MNQTSNLPAERKPQVLAGGPVAALVPQTLDEAFRVAQAIAASGMAPKGMERPEQVMVAIMAGSELGFAPFQSIQSFAIVNNRPSIWGDAIPALLWSRGFELDETFDDEDAPTKATCKVTRPSGKEIVRTFSLGDAKKANLLGKAGPWQTNQKRMLQMRARAFCARDGASDVLRGLPVYEEVADFQDFGRDVTPRVTGMRARLEARAAGGEGFSHEHVQAELAAPTANAVDVDAALDGDTIPTHDADTGEIIEQHLPAEDDTATIDLFPGDAPADEDLDVEGWARDLIADDGLILKTSADVDALFGDPEAARRFKLLKAESPTIATQLEAALKGKKKALVAREAQG